jgi:hypothetical protein
MTIVTCPPSGLPSPQPPHLPHVLMCVRPCLSIAKRSNDTLSEILQNSNTKSQHYRCSEISLTIEEIALSTPRNHTTSPRSNTNNKCKDYQDKEVPQSTPRNQPYQHQEELLHSTLQHQDTGSNPAPSECRSRLRPPPSGGPLRRPASPPASAGRPPAGSGLPDHWASPSCKDSLP